MRIFVSGSLAYDRIMDFPGRFVDHILPEKIHILNVCFMVNGLKERFGGIAAKNFNALPRSYQQRYIGWITSAKKEETRWARMGRAVELLLERGASKLVRNKERKSAREAAVAPGGDSTRPQAWCAARLGRVRVKVAPFPSPGEAAVMSPPFFTFFFFKDPCPTCGILSSSVHFAESAAYCHHSCVLPPLKA